MCKCRRQTTKELVQELRRREHVDWKGKKKQTIEDTIRHCYIQSALQLIEG